MEYQSNKGKSNRKGYSPALWLIELTDQIRLCEGDMKNIISGTPLTLALQLRAYDLLDSIARYTPLDEHIKLLYTQLNTNNKEEIFCNFKSAIECYRKVADSNITKLEQAFEESDLATAAASFLRPWEAQFLKLQQKSNEAIALYNAADYAYKCQQEGDIIDKWRSLRRVRKMAGFRLERGRVGNYVTKTYELMLEVQKELMAAQNQMHSHNVGYKCEHLLYNKISDTLSRVEPALLSLSGQTE